MSQMTSESPGARCAAELAVLLGRYDANCLLLVTGKRSFELSGAAAALAPLFEGRRIVHFNDFSPNPSSEEVERGVALCRREQPDLVLAIGGGSALDLGKMINVVAASAAPARELLTGEAALQGAALPLIAVPTTSGSGAEVTHFSAVYVDGVKYSMTHESLRPTHCILDASLTTSLPRYLTAATGMDALSQAIESYWSMRSTPESRTYSAEAIELCNSSLEQAAMAPTHLAREAMMRGSYLAGKAIDVARTTAPHALSYVLTTDFGVTHGHAVALTLGAVFSYNAAADAGDKEFGALKRTMDELCALLQCCDGQAAEQRLQSLMEACGLQTRLRDMGVVRTDLPRLVASVNPQRLKNNPRELSPQALGAILEAVY